MKNKLLHMLGDLFLVIFFLLFWLCIKPELIYHFQQLGFSSDKTFFREFINYPGGIAEYISLYLFQFNYKAVWGALVFTILLSIIGVIAGEIFKNAKRDISLFLRYVPIILIAILMTDYSFHPVYVLQVFFVLLFFYLIKLILESKINMAVQLVFVLLILLSAYYIIGGFPFMVLSLSVFIYILTTKNIFNIYKLMLIIAVALIAPLITSNFISFINVKDAFLKIIPFFSYYKPGILVYSLLLYLPFILLFNGVIKLAGKGEKGEVADNKSNTSYLIQYSVAVVLLVTGVLLNIQTEKKHKITIDYLAHNHRWDELLVKAKERPSDDRLIQFQTNRALYFTGLLSEKMFEYPQVWGLDGLYLNRYFANEVLLPSTELYFDLGLANEAIQYGNEAISQNDYSPLIIEQLILANIVSDKYRSAQLYINQLKNFIFFLDKAIKYEKYINGIGVPEIDSLILPKREVMPVTDFIVNRKHPQSDLINMLSDNLNNKMAYEYLMAAFLLENDLTSFIKYYSIGKNFNYKSIPVIYQQALILYNYELMRNDQPLRQISVTNEVVENFNEYLTVLSGFEGDKEAAKETIRKKFDTTYWYYLHYVSPVTTKKKIVIE